MLTIWWLLRHPLFCLNSQFNPYWMSLIHLYFHSKSETPVLKTPVTESWENFKQPHVLLKSVTNTWSTVL
jgi:hypothetical protein